MVSLQEEWRAVKGHEGQYEVSDQGRVRSLDRVVAIRGQSPQRRTGRVLREGSGNQGYRIVGIAGRSCYVHRLVLQAFVGDCPPRHEACHWNGVKYDNRLANLRWDTRPENNADRVRHGTSNRGERCKSAKLTESQVRDILDSPKRNCELADIYGVRRSTISRIRTGVRWPHMALEAVK